MARRYALTALVLSTLAIAAAYASAFLPGGAPRWAAWLMAGGTAVMMVAAMALGAARGGSVGRLKVPFAIVLAILAGGFAYALLLPAPKPGDALFLGLPAGAAVILLGVGLLPLLVLPLSYALTFEEMTLSEADLARVREEAKALRAAAAAAPVREPAAAEVGS